MSWFGNLIAWGASFGEGTPAALPIDGGNLNVGEVRQALAGMPALALALSHIAAGSATFSDAEVIGRDAILVADLADPALVPVLTVAAQLIPIIVDLYAQGYIKGDPNPILDAQTTMTQHRGRA